MDIKIDWSNINNSTPLFNLHGEKEAKIVDVYDGDTVKAVFELNNKLYKWTCRLCSINTPEIRTKDLEEKEAGLKVRDILREKILNKVVKLECKEFDKYGRVLVNIYLEDELINKWLIENDHAFEYNGGSKKCWKEHLENK